MRTEVQIFSDLTQLCTSSGYVHVIAHFCFRDNVIGIEENLEPADLQRLFSPDRLIRTEITTLIGLMLKHEINYSLPSAETLEQYIHETEKLLTEMHQILTEPMRASFSQKEVRNKNEQELFAAGNVLREAFFYSGESAYSFQYRDLSVSKYSNDDVWLNKHKGFSIKEARDICFAIAQAQDKKIGEVVEWLRRAPPEDWTILPGFEFSISEIADRSGYSKATIESVLSAFSFPDTERNEAFKSINDFNTANAFPLIRRNEDTFLLFQQYSLVEALYESPFYWMARDASYLNAAMENRGKFTEEFSKKRLALVFGEDNVLQNIRIANSDGEIVGEIDVLVMFANRAIILQAKSKRLTLEARKGNDGFIRDDFGKSIQAANDQGYECAKFLKDANYTLLDKDSKVIKRRYIFEEIYIFCVIADHYPALAFQSRQFLKFKSADAIKPPIVMDVFMLDTMTEFLTSPLYFLSYINRRVEYVDRFFASHEIMILSYHLKNNLWVSDEHDLVMLSDDISSDLDVAMAVRRDGLPGSRTPSGILTKLVETSVGKIIKEIEQKAEPVTIDLGFMLLSVDENTIMGLSAGIDKITKQVTQDGGAHDISLGIGVISTGITVHCNNRPDEDARERLIGHAQLRKYSQKAKTWFGVCIRPNLTVRFGFCLDFKWKKDGRMESAVKRFRERIGEMPVIERKNKSNDLCRCGSGRKYKKCCLLRGNTRN